MTQIGLKLWSPNVGGYLREAKALLGEGIIDYVELYTAPETVQFLPYWEAATLPMVIHCAHSSHHFNLSDSKNLKRNGELFKEAVTYFGALNAKWIIVHPGILGTIDETIRQLEQVMADNNLAAASVLIENKPFINLDGQLCVGATPESIARVKERLGVGIVLDVGHAIKYAIGAGRSWQGVLEQFMEHQPQMLHVSDALLSHPKDEHLHIGSGEFDYETIFSICNALYLSIETVKDHPERLDDFVSDVKKIRGFLAASARFGKEK